MWMQVVVEHPHASPDLMIKRDKKNPLWSAGSVVCFIKLNSAIHEPQEQLTPNQYKWQARPTKNRLKVDIYFSEFSSRIPEGTNLSQCKPYTHTTLCNGLESTVWVCADERDRRANHIFNHFLISSEIIS